MKLEKVFNIYEWDIYLNVAKIIEANDNHEQTVNSVIMGTSVVVCCPGRGGGDGTPILEGIRELSWD